MTDVLSSGLLAREAMLIAACHAAELFARQPHARGDRAAGFLADDGLTLFFVRGPGFGPADLYVTSRRSDSEPFEPAVALRELNTANDERDPWLSPDGRTLYFSSDRSGRYEIYVARMEQD